MASPKPTLTFGAFRLDPVSGQLFRENAAVPLTPKAFALLHYMATRAGQLIPKKELLDHVWPDVFVGDAVLKTTIRDLRKALRDDPHTPRYIETAHRRGYRFIAPVSHVELPAGPIASPSTPRVHYAHSGSVNIAYQVIGSGPIDLVFVMGWVSHLEYFWNEPHFARFLERLGSMARLILFDKRGTGLSDPVPISQLPTLEQRLEDVRAVMEAVGSERAVLMGVSEGGPLCSLFAATYPQRTEALVMIGSYARRMWAPEYPWGAAERDRFCQTIIDEWGGPVGIEERAPSMAGDPAFREWWASYLRMGASPGAAVALTRMNAEIDIRDVLPSIRVPTLVLHRTGDRCLRVEEGRYLASRIPGATFVELPGEDHLPFAGDQDAILSEVERFINRTHVRHASEMVLASVLTVRWEPQAEEHLEGKLWRAFEREMGWARAHTLAKHTDRVVAAFDGPGRAVQCGSALVALALQSGVPARAGVHIGECDLAGGSGPIVEISAGIAEAAGAGDVCVSRTVVDLVPGSGLQFEDRGALRTRAHAHAIPILAVAASSRDVERSPA
jgi:pimeloyl-ACP methyl ester carboxylesterase/class 3 adenylate cyclase